MSRSPENDVIENARKRNDDFSNWFDCNKLVYRSSDIARELVMNNDPHSVMVRMRRKNFLIRVDSNMPFTMDRTTPFVNADLERKMEHIANPAEVVRRLYQMEKSGTENKVQYFVGNYAIHKNDYHDIDAFTMQLDFALIEVETGYAYTRRGSPICGYVNLPVAILCTRENDRPVARWIHRSLPPEKWTRLDMHIFDNDVDVSTQMRIASGLVRATREYHGMFSSPIQTLNIRTVYVRKHSCPPDVRIGEIGFTPFSESFPSSPPETADGKSSRYPDVYGIGNIVREMYTWFAIKQLRAATLPPRRYHPEHFIPTQVYTELGNILLKDNCSVSMFVESTTTAVPSKRWTYAHMMKGLRAVERWMGANGDTSQ